MQWQIIMCLDICNRYTVAASLASREGAIACIDKTQRSVARSTFCRQVDTFAHVIWATHSVLTGASIRGEGEMTHVASLKFQGGVEKKSLEILHM